MYRYAYTLNLSGKTPEFQFAIMNHRDISVYNPILPPTGHREGQGRRNNMYIMHIICICSKSYTQKKTRRVINIHPQADDRVRNESDMYKYA